MSGAQSPYRPNHSPALSLVLAGAALALTGYLIWERMSPRSLHEPAEARPVVARGDLSDYEKTTIEINERVRPSVVQIQSQNEYVPSDSGYAEVPGGMGTGFIWDNRGYVVTNYHVIRGHETVLVRLEDQNVFEATVVGFRDYLDIAVVKLNDPPADLKPIAVGTSSNLKVGQRALAIGNPFGLEASLSTGVVSALGRTMESVAGTPIRGVIQVDAAINPGNSGGPLLDSAGLLIGMNTAIKSLSGSSAGVGFAVPVDTINRVVPRIIEGPDEDQPVLGVFTDPVPLTRDQRRIMITRIMDNSGAEAAGLRSYEDLLNARRSGYGDIIVRIDGTEIQSLDDIEETLRAHQPGDRVPVTVWRGLPRAKQELTVSVQLSRRGGETH